MLVYNILSFNYVLSFVVNIHLICNYCAIYKLPLRMKFCSSCHWYYIEGVEKGCGTQFTLQYFQFFFFSTAAVRHTRTGTTVLGYSMSVFFNWRKILDPQLYLYVHDVEALHMLHINIYIYTCLNRFYISFSFY